MILIQESFTQEEAKRAGGVICVTPQSFSRVQSWKGVEVSGMEYYVKKAIEMGAICKDVDQDGLQDGSEEKEALRDLLREKGIEFKGSNGVKTLKKLLADNKSTDEFQAEESE